MFECICLILILIIIFYLLYKPNIEPLCIPTDGEEDVDNTCGAHDNDPEGCDAQGCTFLTGEPNSNNFCENIDLNEDGTIVARAKVVGYVIYQLNQDMMN